MDKNINIVSDGTPYGTYITDKNGNKIEGVGRIIWDVSIEKNSLTIEFVDSFFSVSISETVLIKMRKWFHIIYVCPEFVGHFHSKGYKVIL